MCVLGVWGRKRRTDGGRGVREVAQSRGRNGDRAEGVGALLSCAGGRHEGGEGSEGEKGTLASGG